MTSREETLNNTIDFVSNTVSRLFTQPLTPTIAALFIRENYYNTINLIRIWEFTLLDLLGVRLPFFSILVGFSHLKFVLDPKQATGFFGNTNGV